MSAEGSPRLPVGGSREPPVETPFRRKLGELFGIDRRTLALFRVALGATLLGDLATRLPYLTQFYSDQGLFPRALQLEVLSKSWVPSLHALSGSPRVQALLFLFAALWAVALIVGYRTKLAVVVCWVMAYSVQARNPFVHTGSSVVLLQLLFWSLLLPLGKYWSVDEALDTSDRRAPQRYLSVATFGILAQIGMVYIFSAHLKSGPEWRSDFSALYYAVNMDSIATPLAYALLPHVELLRVLTLGTMLLEGVGPLFAFSPVLHGPFRCAVILGFFALHIGIALCFRIGVFPYTMLVAWTIWIPSWFWDRFFPLRQDAERRQVRIYYDKACGFCLRMVRLLHVCLALGEARFAPAQDDPQLGATLQRENSWIVVDHDGMQYLRFDAFLCLCRRSPLAWWLAPLLRWSPIRWLGTRAYVIVANYRVGLGAATRWLRLRPRPGPSTAGAVLSSAAAALLLLYVFLFNLAGLSVTVRDTVFSSRLAAIGYWLQLHQGWTMFAPAPRREDGWFVMPTALADGTVVDLWREGAPVSWERPALVSAMYRSQRVIDFMLHMVNTADPQLPMLHRLAWYHVQAWNAVHDESRHAKVVAIYWMRKATPPPGQPQQPAVPVLLYRYDDSQPEDPL